ncbi:MAG: hypothetical protein ACTSXH_15900, partial [Promethearchaeota archaeon]
YFLISDMNLNYNDIIYSYIGDYKIKNILKGKDLVIYNSRPKIYNSNISSNFTGLKRTFLIFCSDHDKVFYLSMLRDFLESELSEKDILEEFKKKYTYEKYFSLMNIFHTKN